MPVDGFYEWLATPGEKLPHFIYPCEGDEWTFLNELDHLLTMLQGIARGGGASDDSIPLVLKNHGRQAGRGPRPANGPRNDELCLFGVREVEGKLNKKEGRVHRPALSLAVSGGPSRTRTGDPLIKSQLL